MSDILEVGQCTIVPGDNLETLRLMPENSIDSCVTDPPYGIGFMGKKWDTFKPGVGESRLVGREISESENPNLNGRKRSPAASASAVEYDRSLEGQRGFQSWTEAWAREVFRVLKPGGHLLVCGAPRSYHRMAAGVEDAGFEIRDCIMWVFGQGFPKSHNLKDEWVGWGTALKPGWEPIVVARKPLIGTVAANMAEHRTGAININGCRVHTDDNLNGGAYSENRKPSESEWVAQGGTIHSYTGKDFEQPVGRWPANVIHDGSAEVIECFPDAVGQIADAVGQIADASSTRKNKNCYGAMKRGSSEPSHDSENTGDVGFKMKPGARRADAGSAARFFYCAKTSKTDRNEGCENLPLKPGGLLSNTSGQHITRRDGGAPGPINNNHPTVKPTALMQWLVRLVTPPGGIVLDPFFGSGSTGKACEYEKFRCLGIEREADYVAIARARVQFAVDNLEKQRG